MPRIASLALAVLLAAGASTGFAAPRPPTQASSPAPADNALSVPVTAALAWQASARATQYDVRFGVANPPPLVSSGQTATSYQPSTLSFGTKYYWRIDAIGAGGTTPGSVWSFTTESSVPPPAAASNPSPADGAGGLTTSITLAWSAASGATGYDVAFGTTTPPPNVTLNQSATTYAPGALANSTTYFWQVTSRNANGATPGPVWSFATAPAGPTDTPLRRLKLLTWNVQHGTDAAGAAAVDAQVALMADLNPDVIGLQEVDITASRDLSTLYKSKLEVLTGIAWNAVWAPAPLPAGTNPEGNLILTRLPIVSSATVQWDVAPGDPSWLGAKRSAAMVEVSVNARRVKLFVTHLDTDVTNRGAQLAQLLNWAQTFPAPRVLGGDFNMMPSEADYATATAQFKDGWATLVNANQSAPGPDPGYTKNRRSIAPWTGQPGRIDYWFHEAADTTALPTEIAVIETLRSDHHALLMWVAVK